MHERQTINRSDPQARTSIVSRGHHTHRLAPEPCRSMTSHVQCSSTTSASSCKISSSGWPVILCRSAIHTSATVVAHAGSSSSPMGSRRHGRTVRSSQLPSVRPRRGGGARRRSLIRARRVINLCCTPPAAALEEVLPAGDEDEFARSRAVEGWTPRIGRRYQLMDALLSLGVEQTHCRSQTMPPSRVGSNDDKQAQHSRRQWLRWSFTRMSLRSPH